MDDTELKQAADFLSIALECMEDGSDEVAIDFLEDVAEDLEDEAQAGALEWAANALASGDRTGARSEVEQVSAELMQDIDSL